MDEGQLMTNTSFSYTLGGKEYMVKRATLKQVMIFQRKVSEIQALKDPSGDLMMAAHAIYLALHEVDPSITEEYVIENTPGDIDVMDVFSKLGFMSQQKVQMMTRLRNSLDNLSPLLGEKSSQV